MYAPTKAQRNGVLAIIRRSCSSARSARILWYASRRARLAEAWRVATRTDFRTSQWRGHQCRSKLGGRSWRWSASAARRVRSTRNAVVVVGAAPEWSCTVCLHERKRELLVIIEIAKDLAVRRAPVVAWSRWGMAALNAASTQGGCSFFSVPWDRLSGLHRVYINSGLWRNRL